MSDWLERQKRWRELEREEGVEPGSPDVDADWWTTTDVARYLGVKVGTVSSYRARGQMPAPDRTIGRTRMWRPSTIRRWRP